MRKALKSAVAPALAVFLGMVILSTSGFAESGDPMFDFYDGLATVIERNMNDPDACVERAEDYIKNNITPLQDAIKRSEKMRTERGAMSQEEIAKMAQEGTMMMTASRGMEAMNRFLDVFGDFGMQHPEHGEEISDILSRYSPHAQGDEY